MVRSSQALRCLQGQSALYTLIHQRHPAPSCGGHAPTAERTMDPARNFKKRNFTESLTPDPELENSLGHKRTKQKTWTLSPEADIQEPAAPLRHALRRPDFDPVDAIRIERQ